MPGRHEEAALDEASRLIDTWARAQLEENPAVLAVEHEAAERRWLVRMAGEDKAFITLWFTLRERTLHHEAGFIPAPEENHQEVYEYLMRVNARLYGMAFAIGLEDAVYLRGQVPIDWLSEDELDRVLGSTWQWCERYFRTAMSMAYATKYRPPGFDVHAK